MNRYLYQTHHREILPTIEEYVGGSLMIRITPMSAIFPSRLRIVRRLHEEAWLTEDISMHSRAFGIFGERSFVIQDKDLRCNYRHE